MMNFNSLKKTNFPSETWLCKKYITRIQINNLSEIVIKIIHHHECISFWELAEFKAKNSCLVKPRITIKAEEDERHLTGRYGCSTLAYLTWIFIDHCTHPDEETNPFKFTLLATLLVNLAAI